MLATYASALLIVVASLLRRAGVLRRCSGSGETQWFETAVGLALLIVVCSVATRAPGRSTTALVICGVLLLASFAYLALLVRRTGPSFGMALPVALL